MKCPRCGENTPDNWQYLECIDRRRDGESRGNAIRDNDRREPDGSIYYRFDWMICAAADCGQIVVRAHHVYRVEPDQSAEEVITVIPRGGQRPIHELVQTAEPGMTRDYREATSVLPFSPRLSAVLSRRILADLLAKYASLSDYRLDDRIKRFKEDPQYPSGLRNNVDALRQMGNWTAHTKMNQDDQSEVIEASAEEAEWSLEIIDRLFEHFIVGPAKDETIRKGIAVKDAQIDRSKP